MYVDLGKRRGRLHFNAKEVVALVSLALSAVGYVVRSEVKFATLQQKVEQCQLELRMLKNPPLTKEVTTK